MNCRVFRFTQNPAYKVSCPCGAVLSVDKSGKINVRVDYDDRGNQLKILISDTGRGISKANLSKIFNPFFPTRDKGTGLGLSLV